MLLTLTSFPWTLDSTRNYLDCNVLSVSSTISTEPSWLTSLSVTNYVCVVISSSSTSYTQLLLGERLSSPLVATTSLILPAASRLFSGCVVTGCDYMLPTTLAALCVASPILFNGYVVSTPITGCDRILPTTLVAL